MPKEAPAFYKCIRSFENVITKKIDLCTLEPKENEFSCDDLNTLELVNKGKNDLIDSFNENQNLVESSEN